MFNNLFDELKEVKCFKETTELIVLIKLHYQGMESIMCSLTLFSIYSNHLLKYKNCVMKTSFQRGFIYKEKY